MPVMMEALALFHAGRFFEAHEAWEQVWLCAPPRDRFFWQALVHVAVALHHDRAANVEGFERQRRKAMMKLAGYLPRHCGIETGKLWRDLQALRSGGALRIETVTIGEGTATCD